MTTHKHPSVFILVLIGLCLVLAACSAGQNSAAPDPAKAAPGAFKKLDGLLGREGLLPALVDASGLGKGDPLALAFTEEVALELPERR